MTEDEFRNLCIGDVVRGAKGNAYVVHINYGNRVVAVRTVEMTNSREWDLVMKANLTLPEDKA